MVPRVFVRIIKEVMFFIMLNIINTSIYQYIRTLGTYYRKFAVGSLYYTIYMGGGIDIRHLSHHMNIQNRLAIRN